MLFKVLPVWLQVMYNSGWENRGFDDNTWDAYPASTAKLFFFTGPCQMMTLSWKVIPGVLLRPWPVNFFFKKQIIFKYGLKYCQSD